MSQYVDRKNIFLKGKNHMLNEKMLDPISVLAGSEISGKALREKLAALDAREPEDMMSKAYERWGERHEALEDALDDLLELLDEV